MSNNAYGGIPEPNYIIVGGGTAGLVLADKLSSKYRVVVLESGDLIQGDPILEYALGSLGLNSDPNKYLANLGAAVNQLSPNGYGQPAGLAFPTTFCAVAGNTLGGGSKVNGLQHVLPTDEYMDEMAALVGDPSWNAANVRPKLHALEKFKGVPGHYVSGTRNLTGPIKVSQLAMNSTQSSNFAAAASAVTGAPQNKDYNTSGNDICTFTYWQLCANSFGIRSPSHDVIGQNLQADSDGIIRRGKLTIVLNARVTKVNFLNGKGSPRRRRSRGIDDDDIECDPANYIGSRSSGSRDSAAVAKSVDVVINGTCYNFSANRGIIISAGFQSPQILERSGVGKASLLNSLGIPVVINNPNVGEHMKNHLIYLLTGVGPAPPAPTPNAYGPYDGGAFLGDPSSPDPSKRSFQILGLSFGAAYVLGVACNRLISEGYVHINSSNPLNAPKYDFAYMKEQADIDSAVEGYKIMYNILQNMGYVILNGSGTNNAPNYALDPNGVVSYVKTSYTHAYHWTGMCRMGTNPSTSVVDSDCRVYGTSNLFVCDVSIYPTNPPANTMVPAYAAACVLAEKLLSLP